MTECDSLEVMTECESLKETYDSLKETYDSLKETFDRRNFKLPVYGEEIFMTDVYSYELTCMQKITECDGNSLHGRILNFLHGLRNVYYGRWKGEIFSTSVMHVYSFRKNIYYRLAQSRHD